jgi:gliding motility associated protien GldN
MKRLIFAFAIIVGLSVEAFAQAGGTTQTTQQTNEPAAPTKTVNKYLEYNYEKKDVKERKAIPYPPLREADVYYAKRVQRVIDTHEKKNQVMVWPKSPLYRIIFQMVLNGEPNSTGKLKAYRSDTLDNALTIADVKKLGGSTETVSVQMDPNDPYSTKDSTVSTPFDYTQVKRWKIYEEWIFDKQSSLFFPRIICLSPMFTPNLNGVPLPEQEMFFLSWNELRPILVNEEVFNPQNDAMRLTYLDFFEQRLFASTITKESNDKDFAIKDFPEFKDAPMDALYESERIKFELFNWEHDLWEF